MCDVIYGGNKENFFLQEKCETLFYLNKKVEIINVNIENPFKLNYPQIELQKKF